MRHITYRKITVTHLRKPVKKDVNSELQWFGDSLGLFGLRDKDKSCFRIFIELLKAAKNNYAISSDEIAYKTGLTRGTVIHHINKLIDSGIIVQAGKGYVLRVHNLEAVVDEIKKDLDRSMGDLKIIAKEIDEKLGL